MIFASKRVTVVILWNAKLDVNERNEDRGAKTCDCRNLRDEMFDVNERNEVWFEVVSKRVTVVFCAMQCSTLTREMKLGAPKRVTVAIRWNAMFDVNV